MYAVIKTGGKQYRVREEDILDIEKMILPKSKKEIIFDDVLLAVDKKEVIVGQPVIKGAKVKAEVLSELRDKKIITHKFKRRKSYHRTIGHRQPLMRVRIKEINLGKQ